MFRIKVCGVTTVEDAVMAADAGADALGLNFYANSPRSIDVATAARIREAVGDRVVMVGLFVNSPLADIHLVALDVGLDTVQLHGDESPEYLARLKFPSTLRAFRARRLVDIEAYLNESRQIDCLPGGVLVDGYQRGSFGGTGAVADWSLAKELKTRWEGSLILAGGLGPENVAAAIDAVRPDGVDVASGVESRPGVKDLELVRRFVSNAKRAYENLHDLPCANDHNSNIDDGR